MNITRLHFCDILTILLLYIISAVTAVGISIQRWNRIPWDKNVWS